MATPNLKSRRPSTGTLRGVDVTWIAACLFLALLFGLRSDAAEKNADSGWPMYNGTYAGDRFSALNQISRENVGSLKETGRYVLPETTSFHAAPLIVGDRLS